MQGLLTVTPKLLENMENQFALFIVLIRSTTRPIYFMHKSQNTATMTFMEKVRTIAYYIVHTKHCSTSKVQRKFGYNFNTCDNAIDILENLGIISNFDTIQYERTVLVGSIEELEEKLDFYF